MIKLILITISTNFQQMVTAKTTIIFIVKPNQTMEVHSSMIQIYAPVTNLGIKIISCSQTSLEFNSNSLQT